MKTDKTVVTTQEARQGKELGVMRYVLMISLSLAVIAGVVISISSTRGIQCAPCPLRLIRARRNSTGPKGFCSTR